MSKFIRLTARVLVLLVIFAEPFFLGIPFGKWLTMILPPLAIGLAVLFVFYPPWTVAVLYGLKIKQAARYAGWTARRNPIGWLRRSVAVQAAHIYYAQGDDKDARTFAELGMRLSEPLLDNVRARAQYALCINILGVLASKAGRYQEALQAFYRPLRMSIPFPIYTPLFQSNCASAFYNLGEWENGLDYARRAIANAPESVPMVTLLAHMNAAQILTETGQDDEALIHAQAAAAIKAAPAYRALAQASLGWTRGRIGDMTGANQAFEEAIKLTKTLPPNEAVRMRFVLFRRGQLFFEKGNLDAAERDLKSSINGDEAQPGALYFLAELAQRRGDEAQAEHWRERLTREVPESFYARRAADGIISAR